MISDFLNEITPLPISSNFSLVQIEIHYSDQLIGYKFDFISVLNLRLRVGCIRRDQQFIIFDFLIYYYSRCNYKSLVSATTRFSFNQSIKLLQFKAFFALRIPLIQWFFIKSLHILYSAIYLVQSVSEDCETT